MCREQLRKRWQDEYLKALQERHQKSGDSGQTLPNIGNIVLVADDNNPKSKWNLGRIIDVIEGSDGVIRWYKIQNNKEYTIERPLQLIRDLEIKTVSNGIDRGSTKTGKHTKADRIIGVSLQNDNELWRVSHKGRILKLIFTLIEWVCWNSSRRFETVDTNCWVEELLFTGQ